MMTNKNVYNNYNYNRLLQEEFEKREELERLKQQQEQLLAAEREQKASLQSDREEQERLLTEAKEKLEQLERDRIAAANKMQVYIIKFHSAFSSPDNTDLMLETMDPIVNNTMLSVLLSK